MRPTSSHLIPWRGRRTTLFGAQLDKIEILRNGKVIHLNTVPEGESQVHDYRWALSETASAWYMVRVTERHAKAGMKDEFARAWTSPIFFRGAAFAPPSP